MNLEYFLSTLVLFLTRFNPRKPPNIHNSCISYCVVALTKVIVFIVIFEELAFQQSQSGF